MIPVVALCLLLPITIFDYKDTGVPLSDIVCFLGLFFFLKRCWSLEAVALYSAIFFAYISVTFGSIWYDDYSFTAMVSVMYLFKPCFAYFVAREIIKNHTDAQIFFVTSAKIIAIFIGWLFVVLILFYGGVVRNDSSLNGSFLGLSLFGAYGVNSLAALYVLMLFILAYVLNRCSLSATERNYIFFAFLAVVYCALGSFSRMAMLGVFALLVVLYKDFLKKHIVLGVFLGVVSVSLSIPLLMWAYDEGVGAAKINQIVSGFSTGDFDYLSSGRLTLYKVALEQVLLNPFSGASFGGFEVYTSSIAGYESIVGLSPHNQYITLFWKMGIPGAMAYCLFLGLACYYALKQTSLEDRRWVWRLLFIVLLVFCSLWDILLVPNVAALFYFMLGAFINTAVRDDE